MFEEATSGKQFTRLPLYKMWAELTYSLLLAVLFLLSLLLYLLCKDISPLSHSVEPISSSKTSSASVVQTVESARGEEALESSQKPKYKKMNLQIEIPQTPKSLQVGDSITCDMVKVSFRQGECMPISLFGPAKALQRYEKAVIFAGQLIADCFVLSLLVWIPWETRGISAYFTAGLVACVSASLASSLATLLFLHCNSSSRPLQPLVLLLLPLLAFIGASFYFLSDLSPSQTSLWLSNFLTLMGLEVAILEPFRTLLKLAAGLYAKESKCWKKLWPV